MTSVVSIIIRCHWRADQLLVCHHRPSNWQDYLHQRYDPVHGSVPLVLSTHVLLFHSCNMSVNSSPLFHCYRGKILCAICWTSRTLQVKFFATSLVFTIPRFLLWGLNQGSREIVWSLCVHARRAIDYKRQVLRFMRFCETVQLYVCYVEAEHYTTFIKNRTAFQLFWHLLVRCR